MHGEPKDDSGSNIFVGSPQRVGSENLLSSEP